VASDFDPGRLTLARRLAGLQRTRVAAAVGVTPAAVTQYEKGASRPTLPVLQGLAEVLGVTPEFFRAGNPVPALASDAAHFRSLRATTSLERESALAFAELALVVFDAVERYVELPAVRVPDLAVPSVLGTTEARALAREARRAMGLDVGPVPNMVRLLEAYGVAVVQLNEGSERVDAFSHQGVSRPVVVLSSLKGDKARRRFDVAHELGHLVMHHDTEPGSRLVEDQAHAFAAEFLAPSDQIGPELPKRLDWPALHKLKQRWGMSLKALVFQSYKLDRFGETTYKRAMKQLSMWGLPEPGPLGPPEAPVLLPRALELLGEPDTTNWLAEQTGLPIGVVTRILEAAGGEAPRPAVQLDVSRMV
jgi:Zn-dependent peptidase ImmA (M78 family)/transcriptional regulator with XRE-family HTH domain